MKKLLTAILAATLMLTVVSGCSPKSETGTPPVESTPQSSAVDSQSPANEADKQITVGIIQMMEHPSLDTIRISFLEEMKALGYTDVNFEHKSGQGDMSSLTTIAQGFVGNKVDAVVAIATLAAQAATSTTDTIPVIFSASTDPVAAELLSNLEKPEGNVTGVSDAIPVGPIFELAKQLTPDAKTFGFVYNLGEVNSVSVINDAKAYCDANGIAYLEATVTNTSEVQQAAQSLVGKVDAFFSPIDNTVATAMPAFVQVALDAGLPIYPGADSMVMDGGLATVGIDYTLLGKETAIMTDAVLKGTPVSELPVVTMKNFRAIVNKDTADALNIDISGLSNVEVFGGENK